VALPGVKLSELDGRVFARFRQLGVKSERLPPEALDDADEDLVERLRLRDGAFLKRAAALLFHVATSILHGPHRRRSGLGNPAACSASASRSPRTTKLSIPRPRSLRSGYYPYRYPDYPDHYPERCPDYLENRRKTTKNRPRNQRPNP
jgi:hypothetical protein